jgi:hypothetical protein
MTPLPPPVVMLCAKCWIEIELLDEDDIGVPREPYWIRLPNGVVRQGRLDDNGFVRLDGIPCGACLVRFPRHKEPRITRETTRAPDEHWLEIKLLDEEDHPVPGEKFHVILPDGSERNGALDANGKARLEKIPPGACRVRFLDIDGGDFLSVIASKRNK